MAPKLIVEVVGDTSQLEKSFKRAQHATGNLDRDLARGGRGAAAASLSFRGLGRSIAFASGSFLAGAGFVAAAKTSVEAASNLNEQMTKSNVVFGRSAGAVEEWSKTTVNSMGLAQDQALETASSFGALLRPIGLTGDAAAQQAERLTKLGADLASFYNTSVQDALQAIRSGLVGEVEPLRRYGVLLSESRVQQEAFNETGKKTVSALTPQEKVLARLAIIYADTSQAQGDFTRTSEGFANQTRILQANVRQLEIELGQALLPALLRIVTAINKDVVPALDGLRRALDRVRQASGGPKDSPVTGFSTVLRLLVDPGYGLGKAIDGVNRLGQAFGVVKTNAENAGVAVGAFVHDMATGLGPLGATRSPLLGTQPDPFARARPVDPFADVRPGRVAMPKGVSVEQRNRIFDARISRALDRVQDIKTLRGQIGQLKVIRGLIDERIAVTKDVTRRLTLGDQVAEINRRILEDQGQIADNAAAAAKKLKEKEDRARKAEKEAQQAALKRATERVAAINKAARAQVTRIAEFSRRTVAGARAREQRQQFLAIGLTATGEQRVPTRGNLLAQLSKAEAAVKGGPLDTKQLENQFTRIRKVLNEGFGKVTLETRRGIADFLDALAGKGQAGGPATKQQAASLRSLVAGTGLSGNQLRRLEFNLAGAHLTTMPVGRGGKPIVVHTHVNLDGKQVARNTTEHQERDQRRKASQTRGRVR